MIFQAMSAGYFLYDVLTFRKRLLRNALKHGSFENKKIKSQRFTLVEDTIRRDEKFPIDSFNAGQISWPISALIK